MNDLSFIEDKNLRDTLENSIEYIYALYEQTKINDQTKTFEEETYRVIILYVVSAIEAVLFYFYKVRGEKIGSLEYKHIHALPSGYLHKEKQNLQVVVAVQEKTEKKDHQIGLYELVTFFKEKKLIKTETAKDILGLNDVRNTFHFSKPRGTLVCDRANVEAALKLLLYTLEKAPRALQIKS